MTKILSAIWVWLGFGPDVQSPPAPEIPQEFDEKTESTAESSGPDSSSQTPEPLPIPPDAWWAPQGETITEPPRLQLSGGAADQALVKELQAFFESPDIELPHLPHVPQRVLTQLRQTDINYPPIAKVLSQDQTLSACVLRQANSAAFASTKEITNLEVALSRLGMKQIRNMMLKESLKALTVRKTTDGESTSEILWKKSVASAVMMEQLSMLFDIQPDEAFLMGLLHDIGEVVLLRLIHDYQQLTKKRIPDHVFAFVRREYHESMGGALSQHWQLPEAIQAVTSNHHGYINGDDAHATGKCLLQIVDMLVSLMGYGPTYPYDVLGSQAARLIGFGKKQSHSDVLSYLPEMVRIDLSLAF